MENNQDWREVGLGEVAADITVGWVGPMTDEYVDSGIPFLRSLNVTPYRIETTDLKYISPLFHQRISKSTLRPGDLVVVRTGRPGSAAVIPGDMGEANCSDLVIIRPSDQLDARFAMYYLNSFVGRSLVDARLVGSVQHHFNIGDAKSLRLTLPPIDEQRAIARILGALDDKIELNRRMNETLEAIARALFQSWFVDFDPVRAKAEGRQSAGLDAETAALFPDSFEASALGPIPRGWQVRRYVDIGELSYGFPFKSSYFNETEGMPVLRIRDLPNNCSPTLTTEEFDDYYVVKAGDILIGMDGEFRAYHWHGDNGLLNQRVCRVRPNHLDFPVPYLKFSIQTPLARIEGSQVGTTVIHLGKKELDSVLIVVPPEALLKSYGAVTERLYQLAITNSQQSRTLAAIRDALLPKLLSGAVRVGEAQALVEEVVG